MSDEVQRYPGHQSVRRKALLVLGGTALCWAAFGIASTLLMRRGRFEADTLVRRIVINAPGKRLSELLNPDLFSSSASTKLRSLFSGLGTIESAQYQHIACQVSGRPCIVTVTLRGRSFRKSADLYIYGSRCLAVEPSKADSAREK